MILSYYGLSIYPFCSSVCPIDLLPNLLDIVDLKIDRP